MDYTCHPRAPEYSSRGQSQSGSRNRPHDVENARSSSSYLCSFCNGRTIDSHHGVTGCFEGRLQPRRRLRAKLLCQHDHCADVLRRVRADGSVRSCQRRRRRSHEAPRGQPRHAHRTVHTRGRTGLTFSVHNVFKQQRRYKKR